MDPRRSNATLALGQLPTSPTTFRRWASASTALHLALLAALLYTRPLILTKVDMPGDRNGHIILLSYNPGSAVAPSSTLPSKPTAKPLPPTPVKSHTLTAPTPAQPAPPATTPSANTDANPGADGLGDGDIKIALELAHPYPKPDLSKLPSGTRGDVIVDIVIDKTGHIASFTLTHGLGHGIDETVLATIQQWNFQPATRNGQPVASEQELLFHYERG
jgi:periplasmic protein TonB